MISNYKSLELVADLPRVEVLGSGFAAANFLAGQFSDGRFGKGTISLAPTTRQPRT